MQRVLNAEVYSDDIKEDFRLDCQHELFVQLLEHQLCLCPLNITGRSDVRVLDIGTRTGRWAYDWANRYPQSSVVGIDTHQLPYDIKKCYFRRVDLKMMWPWHTSFDLIHARMLFASISLPKGFFQQAFRALRTDGYLELQEVCYPIHHEPDGEGADSLRQWSKLIQAAAVSRNLDLKLSQKFQDLLNGTGFVGVQQRRFEWPIGGWASTKDRKLLGEQTLNNILNGLEGFSRSLLTTELKVSEQDFRNLLDRVRAAFKNTALRPWLEVYIVWGRKPGPMASPRPSPAESSPPL